MTDAEVGDISVFASENYRLEVNKKLQLVQWSYQIQLSLQV